mgnify:CR=1 FL=1
MSLKAIGKAMAKELMETKEYQRMNKKRKELYTHPKLSTPVKNYEAKQVKIVNMSTSPEKKQSLMTSLAKEYQGLLVTREMKEYRNAIDEFQRKTFAVFNELNVEISKIINP